MYDSIEPRLDSLGPALPATEGESYYGAAYGTMKPFHITGSRCISRAMCPSATAFPCTRDASVRRCPSSRGPSRRRGPQ